MCHQQEQVFHRVLGAALGQTLVGNGIERLKVIVRNLMIDARVTPWLMNASAMSSGVLRSTWATWG